jgi:hypothetical protein
VVKVSGSDVTVRDTSGIVHVVHTNESTRVSRQESLTDLTDGANVSVQGQPDQSGGIAATAITEHPGGNPTPPPPGASGNASGAAPSGTTSSARTQAAPPGQ